MAGTLYTANTFMFTPNRAVHYITVDTKVWLIVSEVLISIKDENGQITGARLVPCVIRNMDSDTETSDYLIEKNDLCAYLTNKTQSFKASVLARKLQGLHKSGEDVDDNPASSYQVEADFCDDSEDVYFADSAQEIPAVYEFNYNEYFVRAIIHNQQVWFVAFDVFRKILGLNTNTALDHVADKEKGHAQIKSLDAIQDMSVISEHGLQQVFERYVTRLPEIQKLRKWINRNVLPTLHEVLKNRQETRRSSQLTDAESEAIEFVDVLNITGAEPIKLWAQIVHNNVPLNIYKGDGTWWFSGDQIELLLKHQRPYTYLNKRYKNHKELLEPLTRLYKVRQHEGQREVCREQRLWSVEGLLEVFKRMQEPQEKAILQELSKRVGKLIGKDIYFWDGR